MGHGPLRFFKINYITFSQIPMKYNSIDLFKPENEHN